MCGEDAGNIRYLNTDLDLVADFDLAPLTGEFGDLVLQVTRGGDGLWYATCSGDNESEPETNLVRLLDAVDGLSPAARNLWIRCSKREFNVGYDCGSEPWAFNQGLSNDVLGRMAASGASFRITLYPADSSVEKG